MKKQLGLQAYQVYCGLVNHFRAGSTFDGWAYNFKTRVTEETFDKKNSKWQFIKIGSEHQTSTDLIRYMAPAFLKLGYVNPTHVGKSFKTHYKSFTEEFELSKRNFLTTLERICNHVGHISELFGHTGQLPNIYNACILGDIKDADLILLFIVIHELNRVASKEELIYDNWYKVIDFKKKFYSLYITRQEINELRTSMTNYIKSRYKLDIGNDNGN